ncbi:hypothetical protein BIPXVNHO_CDS0045 [Staphylococcus phage PG-2021_27]|nr:hypothetical protein CoNPh38_CDS0377 [Staphylococcus phage S-CoN_Ph38]
MNLRKHWKFKIISQNQLRESDTDLPVSETETKGTDTTKKESNSNTIKPKKEQGKESTKKPELDMDKGFYTLEMLEKFLFNNGFEPYLNGIVYFKDTVEKYNEVILAPIPELNLTFIGKSQGLFTDSELETTNLDPRVEKYARVFKPMFCVQGFYPPNAKTKESDLFYYLKHDLKFKNVNDLEQKDIDDFVDVMYGEDFKVHISDVKLVSPITTTDFEFLTLSKLDELIENGLKKYNNSKESHSYLTELVNAKEFLESEPDNEILYAPLLNKIVGYYTL